MPWEKKALSETQKKVLSVSEAAVILQIGRNLCYEAIRRVQIPAIRVGGRRGRLLVPVAALDRLLEGGSLIQDDGRGST